MDASMINRLVSGLGRTYEDLVNDGVIQEIPLRPSFESPQNEDLIQNPEPGVELWFWAETRRLERILLALDNVVEGEEAYTGELPAPFTHHMDQASVRAVLGEPYEFKGAVKIPLPGGIGGWDAYRIGKAVHPSAKVIAQYSGDMTVNTLAFNVIELGHD